MKTLQLHDQVPPFPTLPVIQNAECMLSFHVDHVYGMF